MYGFFPFAASMSTASPNRSCTRASCSSLSGDLDSQQARVCMPKHRQEYLVTQAVWQSKCMRGVHKLHSSSWQGQGYVSVCTGCTSQHHYLATPTRVTVRTCGISNTSLRGVHAAMLRAGSLQLWQGA